MILIRGDLYQIFSSNQSASGLLSQDEYCVANDGTGLYTSIQSAINLIAPGQICRVKAGDYSDEGVITISRSGTQGNLLILEGVGNVITQGFVVEGNYIKIDGFYISNTNPSWTDYGIYVSGDNVILSNNHIYYSTRGGINLTSSSNNCVVRENQLERNGMAGIEIHGTNHLVEDNEVWGTIQRHPSLGPNYPDWLDADGMRFFGSGHEIRGNYIHDITHADSENVRIGDYPVPHIDCFQTWDEGEPAINIVFENNICDNAERLNLTSSMGTHGFMLHSGSNITIKNNIIKAYLGINTDANPPASNLYIYNNVFAGDLDIDFVEGYSWPSGISLVNTANSVVKNNIFYNNDYEAFYISGVNISCNNNIVYKSNGESPRTTACNGGYIETDPEFISPETGNYNLQSSSPAIDAGSSLSGIVDLDINGESRPQGDGWDIGVYEVDLEIEPDLDITGYCGDGNIDLGEICDDEEIGLNTCSSVNGGDWEGNLSCLNDCSGYDTSNCTEVAEDTQSVSDDEGNDSDISLSSDNDSSSNTSSPSGSSSSNTSSSTSSPSGSSSSNTSSSTSSNIPNNHYFAHKFNQNLSIGSVGLDVRELQKSLNSLGFTISNAGPGSPGQETTYFGPATRQAVIKFQTAHGIKPAGGYFGLSTRSKINELLSKDISARNQSVQKNSKTEILNILADLFGKNSDVYKIVSILITLGII